MKLALVPSLMALTLLAACSTNSQKAASAQPQAPAASASPAASPSPAPAATPSQGAGKNIGYQFACEKDKDARKVEIFAVTPKGCELTYTKYGKAEQIASSANGMQHCQATGDKIRKNLESAGYQCK